MGFALVLTLFVRLGQQVFVYVQRTFGFVFLLATYHVFATRGAKALSPTLKWYMAALATAGHRGLRLPLAAATTCSCAARATLSRPRTGSTASSRRSCSSHARSRSSYKPGQFVFVELPLAELRAHQRAVDISLQRQVFSIRAGEISNQFHPFSITSAPGERTLRIAVKAIGDYTSALRRLLDEGAEAIVEGPFGSFSNVGLPQPRQIWAAGGIGVTPFLSMARSLGDGGLAAHFHYAVERAEEAHFLDEFRAIEAQRDDFEVTVVPRDPDGFLTVERLAAENPELGSSDVLICGPPAMIISLRAQLVAHGLPERQVHAEEFGFAKRGPEAAPPPAELPEPARAAAARVAAARGALRARVRGVRVRGRRARRAEPLVGQ